MPHLQLLTALALATGLAIAATVVQATVAHPAKPAFTVCAPAAGV
jgi:hypothetical protein